MGDGEIMETYTKPVETNGKRKESPPPTGVLFLQQNTKEIQSKMSGEFTQRHHFIYKNAKGIQKKMQRESLESGFKGGRLGPPTQ